MFGFFRRLIFLTIAAFTFPIWLPFYLVYTVARILFWVVTGHNLTTRIEAWAVK